MFILTTCASYILIVLYSNDRLSTYVSNHESDTSRSARSDDRADKRPKTVRQKGHASKGTAGLFTSSHGWREQCPYTSLSVKNAGK